MASIGPQMPSPPKRKRSSSPDGPPSKRRNSQEINLDSDSDSDVGPALPAPNAATNIGPSLPSNSNEINLESDSDAGPQPPAGDGDGDDSDSSDDFTPALPGTIKPTIGPSMPPDASSTSSSAPVRDEWMLAPPTASGYKERDTTKIRSRKFAAKPSSGDKSVSSIWTETPEQKLQRQRDAVLGKTAEGPSTAAAAAGPSREQEERDRKIAAAIDATRGKSLYEEHSHTRKTDDAAVEDDDPSKRAFDREKDMAIGGKIGTTKRKELVAQSAGFSGRFQKGSYL